VEVVAVGIFDALRGGNPDDVPDTIGEQQMNEIRAAGRWAHRHEDWTSPEAVDRRLAANEQHEKRWLS
jgi:hypothetical protein